MQIPIYPWASEVVFFDLFSVLPQRKMFSIIKGEGESKNAEKLIREFVVNLLEDSMDEEAINTHVEQVSGVWFKHFLMYDPIDCIRKVTVSPLWSMET